MKGLMLGVAAALLAFGVVITNADAARMGGGRSIGAQRSMTNVAPVRPTQQAQAAPAKQASAAPAGAQPASGLGRWAPLLGGLAVGGLLGALLGGSGFGSMLMGWLVVGALVFAVVFLVRALAQRRGPGAPALRYAAGGGNGAYQSVGNETVAAPPPSQAAGFDARPVAAAAPSVPAGFDASGFLRAAKLNFMKLQLANDAGNLDELREFATPDLYEELKRDVLARGGGRQHTDVVSLNADLLEVVTEGDRHWASVRFSGQVRETSAAAAEAFEEVWNLAKPVNGSSGWLLAGIQQMH